MQTTLVPIVAVGQLSALLDEGLDLAAGGNGVEGQHEILIDSWPDISSAEILKRLLSRSLQTIPHGNASFSKFFLALGSFQNS